MSPYPQRHREFLRYQFCKARVLKANGPSDVPACSQTDFPSRESCVWSCPVRLDQEQNEWKQRRNRAATELHRENRGSRPEECRIRLQQRDGSRRTLCLAFESRRLAPVIVSRQARAPESGCGCDRQCRDIPTPAPARLPPFLQGSCGRRSRECGNEMSPANSPSRSILGENVSLRLRTRPSFPVAPAV